MELSSPLREKGERAITADTAFRLGRFFKMSAQFWLNLQSHYDLEIMEDRLGDRPAKRIARLMSVTNRQRD